MAVNMKFTCANSSSTGATVFDLTDTDINPGAAPTSTPRQGGFTLRNRINFSNVALTNKKLFTIASSGSAAQVGNVLRVLEVPERVQVNRVNLYAVKSETVPGSYLTGSASGLHASALATLAIGVNVEQRSKPLDDAAYDEYAHLDLQLAAQRGMPAGGQFGEIPLAKAGAAVVGGCAFEGSKVEAVDSSMTAPELARIVTQKAATGSAVEYEAPAYFPLGGYVYLGCTDVTTGNVSNSGAKADDTYAYLTGTWEVQAQCTYVPE